MGHAGAGAALPGPAGRSVSLVSALPCVPGWGTCPLASSGREQGHEGRVSAAEMAAAALPPCSALRALTEPGCWLCSPGLQHHRIQCLPEINLPVKHCQDSSSQALLSSCCRTRWGRGSISNAPWWGLLNKSILAQRQHCPCGVVRLCVCVPEGDLFLRAVQELQVLKVSCTPLAPRECQCYMLGPVLLLDTPCREHT